MTKWISVKKRLPEDNHVVLVAMLRNYDKDYQIWADTYENCLKWNYGKPTHWMPLPLAPEPPKKVIDG